MSEIRFNATAVAPDPEAASHVLDGKSITAELSVVAGQKQ